MAELQIIGAAMSNFVWVTRIACVEKGAPYALVPVMPHTPEVDAIHPLGKVPVMRHGDVSLCESRAIIGYIDRTFDGPSLTPRDPAAAAQVEQWVSMVCTAIDPLLIRQYYTVYVMAARMGASPDRAAIDGLLPKMEAQFAVLDRAVAKSGHLAGDSFSLADAYLMPVLYYMNAMPEGGALLAKSGQLKAYYDRHVARPSVQQTKPEVLVHQMMRR